MSNAEWDLLTKIVTANNQQDHESLYKILADENNDFTDKPRCVQAAVSAIRLVEEHVNPNKDVLQQFVEKVGSVEMDMRTGIRFEVLKEMLGIAQH